MKLAMIYMASGFGRRFGSNKLLIRLAGRPLYQYGLNALEQAALRLQTRHSVETELIVVSQYEEILAEAGRRRLLAVRNEESAEGMAASLRLGTQAAEGTDAFLYLVADEPRLTAATLTAFAAGFFDSGALAGCVHEGGRRGNPAIFDRSLRPELLALRGDEGGRSLLRRFEDRLWLYEAACGELRDIDCPQDLGLWPPAAGPEKMSKKAGETQ